jgi:hypothetical protein
MARNKLTDFSETPADNTDVANIGVAGTNSPANFDDATRAGWAILAKVDRGTDPVRDTWTFADPADLTKRVRLDAGNVTAGQTRVITVPDANITLPASFATINSLEGLTLGAGDMLYATAADTLADLAIGTAGQFLVTNASATAPEWASRPTLVSLEGLSLAAGDILYATAADTLARLPKGTAAQLLAMNAGATAPEWVTLASYSISYPTVSGTSIEQTGVASTVTEIVISWADLGFALSDSLLVQMGDSGGYETSGYTGSRMDYVNSAGSGSTGSLSSGAQFSLGTTNPGGQIVLKRATSNGRTWSFHGSSAESGPNNFTTGYKTLSAALDRVRLIGSSGQTFNSGSVSFEMRG